MATSLAVVLAAGKGKRMKTDRPKVLCEALGRPLVGWVLDALERSGVTRSLVVVGYQAERVRDVLAGRPNLEFVEQTEQRGTGHAVMVCRELLERHDGPVLVVAGDSPLLQPASVSALLAEFDRHHPACLLGTLHKDNPAGLGRILRDADGRFLGIVEEKDATAEQRQITEVNMSTYVFDCRALLGALERIRDNNCQREYYLTDCPGILKAEGRDVRALPVLQPCEALSVNTVEELSVVEAEMRRLGYLDMRELKIFSGRAHPELALALCHHLNLPLGKATLTKFPDTESHCKIEEDVRGRDVFLVQPTCPPVNDNLVELLIMIDSVKRASADRITAVIPYFGYARQDRKDEGRVPITAKLVANLIQGAGANRVLTMDLHAAQIQGFFDIPVDHLYAAPVLNAYFQQMNLKSDEIVVVSPDEGSIKRAIGHARRLGGNLAIIDKRRANATKTKQENLIGGPIAGRVALIFDDLISTAGSICGAAQLLQDGGAREIHVAATHGVLCGDAMDNIRQSAIKTLAITDSIPLKPEQHLSNIKVLSVAPLLAEAIKRIYYDQSISAMFRGEKH